MRNCPPGSRRAGSLPAETHWQGEVDQLGHEIAQADEQLRGLRSLKESTVQVRRRLDTMTDEEQAEVVRLGIDSVLIHSDIVEVVLALDNRVGQATSPWRRPRPRRWARTLSRRHAVDTLWHG